jgi:peptidoglycan/LPS O-acetylase OafA/YrhL
MSFRPPGYFRLTADTGAIPALDGLRGIAILMVVLYHVTDSFVSPEQPLLSLAGWDLATPLLNGWMGVQLFFVLSGFLITHHLLRRFRSDRGPELGRYLVKRWLRIVPTYYVVLAIAALGLVPYYDIEPGRMGARVLYHALFLQDYLPSSLLGPFWSLGVEEKFYLVAPLFSFLLVSVRRPGLAMLALLLLACIPLAARIAMVAEVMPVDEEGGFTRIWRNPFHLSMDALVVGCAVAWLSVRRDAFGPLASPLGAKWLFLAGLAGVAALLAIPSAAVHGTLFDRVALYPLTAVAFGCVLAGVVVAPKPPRALESRWLARAGRVAYPWYLVHVLVMWALWGSLNAVWPGLSGLSGTLQLALFLPAYLATSAAAALTLHFAVEKPCLILKDGIDRSRPAPYLDFRTESA